MLIIKIPNKEVKSLECYLKSVGGRIIKKKKIPNATTLKAMSELKTGKGIRFFESVELFKRISADISQLKKGLLFI